MEEINCIFCSGPVTLLEDLLRKTGPKGFGNIFSIAEVKKDFIAAGVLSIKDRILKDPQKYKFHGACRKSFIHKRGLDMQITDPNCPQETSKKFNIKTDCFICGKNKVSLEEKEFTRVTANSASKVKKKLKKAASDRGDDHILKRIETHSNLYTAKAKYHSYCFTNYLNPRCVAICKKKQDMKIIDDDSVKQALWQLYSEVEKDILVGQKSTTMNFLRERFEEILYEKDISTCEMSIDRLQMKLELFFGQKMSFASHPGKPTIVYPTEAKFDIIASSVHGYKHDPELQTQELDQDTKY
ncbi:hypothetical protein JTB14_038324 [Gonioctena quinquepunctata]|nr:hypothetical protein JTB14_038324 [Gonioctena quinquepunctata]